MASVDRDESSGRFRVRFRFGGKSFKRSLKTTVEREAEAVAGRVEETIRLLERGRLEMPPDTDPGSFILSDGTLSGKPSVSAVRTLGQLLQAYQQQRTQGAKEPETIRGEDRHITHLLRILQGNTVAQGLIVGDLQRYVDRRSKERWRGSFISPETIEKEIRTFRLIWNWGLRFGYVKGPAPIKGVEYPKLDEKPPFMTWAEIERRIERGKLSQKQEKRLWGLLFLTTTEISEFLEMVREQAAEPFSARGSTAWPGSARRRFTTIRSVVRCSCSATERRRR